MPLLIAGSSLCALAAPFGALDVLVLRAPPRAGGGGKGNPGSLVATGNWDAAATCYSFNLNIALAAELVSYLAYLANCR